MRRANEGGVNLAERTSALYSIEAPTGIERWLTLEKVPRYEFSRVGFRVNVIKLLGRRDRFRIVTSEGTFDVKAVFDRDSSRRRGGRVGQ